MTHTSEYMKKYRGKNPEYVERQKQLQKARHKATQVLVNKHWSEYCDILQAIKEEMGLN